MGRPSQGSGSIKLVGVELEGQWGRRPSGFVHDGSVSGLYGNYVGEVPSKPMLPEQMGDWVLTHYPEESNNSCGMHTHMSFTSKLAYSLLMEHASMVERKLLDQLRLWGRSRNVSSSSSFWHRLAGENRYCHVGAEASPDDQASINHKGGDRYHVLNFCYRLHGTLEVRVLPMFKKPELAVSALECVYRTINDLLVTLPKLASLEMETEIGLLKCHAWKQGYTVSLLASPRIKAATREQLFPGVLFTSQRRRSGRRQLINLGYALLVKDHVQCPVRTQEGMRDLLYGVQAQYERLTVSLTRKDA